MKILVLQYEMQRDGGVVFTPSNPQRDIEIVLPDGCNHIVIEKEEIAPRTVYRIFGVDESELQRSGQ